MDEEREGGASPVIGVILLVALTLILAAAIFSASVPVIAFDRAPTARISIDEVDPSTEKVVVVHGGGDSFNISEVKVLTYIDGELLKYPLEREPGQTGYYFGDIDDPGPIYKWSSDKAWDVGDACKFQVASTNSPSDIEPGDSVSVKVVHEPSGSLIAESTYTAH